MIIEDIIRDSIMVNDDTKLTILDRFGHVQAAGEWFNDNVLEWSRAEVVRFTYDSPKNTVRVTIIEDY